MKPYQERIVRDQGICGGQPVFKGTRVRLRTVLASLAEPRLCSARLPPKKIYRYPKLPRF